MGHNNRNIATYHDAAVDYVSNILYIYMDYYPGGNVQGLLDEVQTLQPILALEICSAIASGIACCHENGIFHRTFTLADVLLKRPLSQINGQLLACDRGAPLYPLSGTTMHEVSCQCREIIQGIREEQFHGSVGHQVVIEGSEFMNASASLDVPPFVSPEFQHQWPAPAVSEKADSYVLGVLCHILLTGKSPFSLIKTQLEWPSGFSTALRDLVLHCLDSDLEARPRPQHAAFGVESGQRNKQITSTPRGRPAFGETMRYFEQIPSWRAHGIPIQSKIWILDVGGRKSKDAGRIQNGWLVGEATFQGGKIDAPDCNNGSGWRLRMS
jgi:serine/threonine protein kinase